jgi:hypothetical protein
MVRAGLAGWIAKRRHSGLHPTSEAALEMLTCHGEIVPVMACAKSPLANHAPAGSDSKPPRAVRAIDIGVDNECDLAAPFIPRDHSDGTIRNVVLQVNFGSSMRSGHRAAELAHKTVWAIDPEVVASTIGVKQPIVHDGLPRLNGVTAWDPTIEELTAAAEQEARKRLFVPRPPQSHSTCLPRTTEIHNDSTPLSHRRIL